MQSKHKRLIIPSAAAGDRATSLGISATRAISVFFLRLIRRRWRRTNPIRPAKHSKIILVNSRRRTNGRRWQTLLTFYSSSKFFAVRFQYKQFSVADAAFYSIQFNWNYFWIAKIYIYKCTCNWCWCFSLLQQWPVIFRFVLLCEHDSQ